MPMKRDTKRAIAALLTSERLTDEDRDEAVELLNIDHPPTAWERSRLTAILDKAKEPAADPTTVGWSRLPKELKPELGCLSVMAELLHGVGREEELTGVGKIEFPPLFNIRRGAVGADECIGWLGWVSNGLRSNRSDDLFDTWQAAEAWTTSILDRKSSRQ